MANQTILIVDDDSHIRDVVRFSLDKAGYRTFEAEDGKKALDIISETSPHLIILDILMPELDGIETCKKLRKTSDVPIIFLSSQDDEIDRIVGLEIGADDYISKPFSPRELVARVKAVLRRSNTPVKDQPTNEIRHQSISFDREKFQTSYHNKLVDLTATEFELFATLLSHPQKVYTRDQLMDLSYKNGELVTDRTIDSHIRKIRSKLRAAGCEEPIETVRGVGYRLGDCT